LSLNTAGGAASTGLLLDRGSSIHPLIAEFIISKSQTFLVKQESRAQVYTISSAIQLALKWNVGSVVILISELCMFCIRDMQVASESWRAWIYKAQFLLQTYSWLSTKHLPSRCSAMSLPKWPVWFPSGVPHFYMVRFWLWKTYNP
jgi:hypothetical protein